MQEFPWPRSLWLVRHGESTANVADFAAAQARSLRLDIAVNDIDVPLSQTGERQAEALGHWLKEQPADRKPSLVVSSAYRRAQQTAEIALGVAQLDALPRLVDERFRDREQGVLDRLTRAGVMDAFPDEASRHDYLGKFWYRPPAGESWADVALRVRSALLELRLTAPEERVMVFTHDVTVLVTRYVVEQLAVPDAVALSGLVPNCSVTRYEREDGRLALDAFADTTAVEQAARTPVTSHD
ncbi:MAG TPA: histidine phosphatase family protein [Mycobacteriales bacterium]|nr:histidine phosphatase family protein [Mycobacteriales bacterium]